MQQKEEKRNRVSEQEQSRESNERVENQSGDLPEDRTHFKPSSEEAVPKEEVRDPVPKGEPEEDPLPETKKKQLENRRSSDSGEFLRDKRETSDQGKTERDQERKSAPPKETSHSVEKETEPATPGKRPPESEGKQSRHREKDALGDTPEPADPPQSGESSEDVPLSMTEERRVNPPTSETDKEKDPDPSPKEKRSPSADRDKPAEKEKPVSPGAENPNEWEERLNRDWGIGSPPGETEDGDNAVLEDNDSGFPKKGGETYRKPAGVLKWRKNGSLPEEVVPPGEPDSGAGERVKADGDPARQTEKKGRLSPTARRVLMLLFVWIPLLSVAALAGGVLIGYSVIGNDPAKDVFTRELWQHLYDLIYG
ncbi:DNA-directed RNA polymerase subunit beta [Melghirimyces profundicolus]|uniref:DNA-directed RNA polymerase subunit beta n=1 Tax=Melghirimyces profundicolus TaxID=1242148 RepID=A0A2T6C2K5_9BACL|nr:DNA-directed RNA polymerase subunit beta [Melghirimyces profundicolus]PTX62538.1 DNA-directed RNA polymerase subunit beta [Melghirimyces profundicolus]